MEEVLRQIEAWRNGAAPPRALTVRASEVGPYAEVADSGRAPFVRHLLAAAGADEHRLCRWRLEHKLVQAQVFGHYAPDAFPRSRGLISFAAEHRGGALRAALEAAFPCGFLIKSALGDSSGEERKADVAAEALAAIESGEVAPVATPAAGERWLIQERLRIAREFRVHSFDRRVVEHLTYHRYGGRWAVPEAARQANEFVQSILRRLPEGIVCRSCLAWDVVVDPDGRHAAVEVNIAGVHPEYRPGFQCSGFLQHERIGAWCTAVLIRHIERHHGMEIAVIDDAREPWPHWIMYAEVMEELRRMRG